MALAVTRCMGAGLLVRCLALLNDVDAGVAPDGGLTALVTPRPDAYQQPDARISYYREVRERIGAVPGVTAVGAAQNVPYAGRYNSDWTFQRVADRASSVGDSPAATVQMVTPGYFEAAGLAVIGQRMGAFSIPEKPWMEVVGIVANVHVFGLDRPTPPISYVPTTQSHVSTFFTPREMTLFVRGSREPSDIVAEVRMAIAAVDPTATVSAVQPLADIVEKSLRRRSVTFTVLATFGGIALALAGIGVWASTIAAVHARRGEIGIRLALGERRFVLATRLLREVFALVAVGSIIGVAIALSGARLISSLLYGVSTWDPLTIGAVTLVLALTALVAAALPTILGRCEWIRWRHCGPSGKRNRLRVSC